MGIENYHLRPMEVKKHIGWTPNGFIDNGDGTWKGPYNALVGNFYMIDEKLYNVSRVIHRQEQIMGGEDGNTIEKMEYSILELFSHPSQQKLTGSKEIEAFLQFFFR